MIGADIGTELSRFFGDGAGFSTRPSSGTLPGIFDRKKSAGKPKVKSVDVSCIPGSYNYALGDKEGIVNFELTPNNQGRTIVHKALKAGVENIDYAVEKTVDSFQIEGQEILLKIDIEGFECNLFKNFEGFFLKNTVHRVVNLNSFL